MLRKAPHGGVPFEFGCAMTTGLQCAWGHDVTESQRFCPTCGGYLAAANGEQLTLPGSSSQRGREDESVDRDRGQLPLLARYERNADLPLMVLSLAVIPLVAVEYLADLRPRAEEGLELTYTLIWLAFLADYVIRLLLTPRGE